MGVEKKETIYREVAYHPGVLCRHFTSCEPSKDNFYNSDETHIQNDFFHNRTQTIKGDENIRFSNVLSGEDGMNLIVMLRGCPNISFCLSILPFFKKTNGYYPISGVPGDNLGIIYSRKTR